MSKHKKVVKQHEVAAKMLKEARDRMEQFCINDFTPMRGFNEQARYEAWVAKVKAMSDRELAVEFNKRDGDHVLQHGCAPEFKDSEETP
jgi:hypothetical protein